MEICQFHWDYKRVNEQLKNSEIKTFCFIMTYVFSNHFWGRHMIDDHNNQRHSVPSIENSWVTHRWADRVFSFLLAITEVNAYNCFRYFIWEPAMRTNIPSIQQF